jgi:hypothetical protein
MPISSSKKVFLDHARPISYNPQKDVSNGVLCGPIKDHLALATRGFVVGSQIHNLIPNLSFDHNSCILGLNE